IGLNTVSFDAAKHDSQPLVADAREGLSLLTAALGDWKTAAAIGASAKARKADWMEAANKATATTNAALPSDAQVIGAVQRTIGGENSVVVCAAGGLPGELHKLWQAVKPGGYHMEYGFSCMGYEIAGGLGVKLARPEADVVVMV